MTFTTRLMNLINGYKLTNNPNEETKRAKARKSRKAESLPSFSLMPISLSYNELGRFVTP